MTGVDIYEFIKPHLGSIYPSGDHSKDSEKIGNMKIYDELLNCLLFDLDKTLHCSNDYNESSIRALRTMALGILGDKKAFIDESFEDVTNIKGELIR